MHVYQPAFSLLELMIVIALFSLVSMISIGSYQSYHRFLISVELNQLRLLLLCLRYKAMALHSTISVLLNPAQHSYTFDNQAHHMRCALFNYLPGTMGPPAYPHQMIVKAITFDHDRINFYADGSVSAGTLYVTDKQNSCMYALTIAVNEFFNIRIYSYNASQPWHLIA